MQGLVTKIHSSDHPQSWSTKSVLLKAFRITLIPDVKMLGFVAAARIKFTPCIMTGSFWVEHYEIFFLVAKSALVIRWVIGLAPSYDFPIHCVGNFLIFEDPNMFTSGGVVCIFVFECG